jgi:hypothetical protein
MSFWYMGPCTERLCILFCSPLSTLSVQVTVYKKGHGVMKRKKKIGRPPKPEADRKATHFTFRTRGSLREQLLAAAAASGKSVSEEIERRLELSFRADEMLEGLRDLRVAVGLPRNIGDLPPDTPVSLLTVDHLDQLRHKLEQERAGQPASKRNEKETVS